MITYMACYGGYIIKIINNKVVNDLYGMRIGKQNNK